MESVGDLNELIDSTGSPLLDKFMHIGLFVGAIFQLICIFALVFLPAKTDEMVIKY